MKHFFKIFSLFLIMNSCSKSKNTNCIIIDQFDNTHLVFPVSPDFKLDLNNLNFLNKLDSGFLVFTSDFSIDNHDSVYYLHIPNSSRNINIYGKLDKYYNVYLVKIKNFHYKIISNKQQTINLEMLNNKYSFKFMDAKIDSLDVIPLK